MPTCIEPKLPPPAKTKAVFPVAGSRGLGAHWNAAESVMASRASRRSTTIAARRKLKQGCGFQLAVIASHAVVTSV
jgi:hypothetical protein